MMWRYQRPKQEKVEEENVLGCVDASQNLDRITRRAHRSEGGDAILGVPASLRVTKSLCTGLNSRENDLLDFVNGSLKNIPDEQIRPQDGPVYTPLHPVAEVRTSEQMSQQHEASLAEESLPEHAGDDAPEEMNQSEEEDMIEFEAANQNCEPHSDVSYEEDMIDPEPAKQSPEHHSAASDEEDMIDSEPANQSPEPHSPTSDEQEDGMIEPEPANKSPEPHSPTSDEQEEDDDDACSAELSMKTPAFV
ncbi:fibrous sheath CABYR-binding protein-like [Myxocyprinus asiaticus]|uniref:fibrous sheath CABYR-binding protein-like n=1 Tax=Myxocyprinus asiaticus TaxID=70543 RepID=UPI0022214BD1|nr:fibrous sheath CABYR-binding protein-like [Myxocyprinus asiaticus]